MTQTYVNNVLMNSEEVGVISTDSVRQKRKVNFTLDEHHHVSVFQTGQAETVINVRKGTRSVSISKSALLGICNLKETLLLCCSFIEHQE